MAVLTWNLTTNAVLLASGLGTADFEAARGPTLLQLLLVTGTDGGTPVLLAADQMIGLVICDPANLAAGYLGGNVTLTRGATPADGYTVTVNTDTTFTRARMHVDDPTTPEDLEFPAQAVFYQFSATTPASPSLPFDWTVLAAYVNTGLPPADIVAQWPLPEQLLAAIAQAAAAQPRFPAATANGSYVTVNTDGSVQLGPLPTTYTYTTLTVSGAFAAGTLTGNGAALTALNPANLSAPVPLTLGGTGKTNAADSLAGLGGAPLASPAFTGNGSISGSFTAQSFNGSATGLTNVPVSALVGIISFSNLPAALAGALNYLGTWNASTNSPTITSGAAGAGQAQGSYYVVSVSGTTTVDGVAVWNAGDWIVFDGVRWDKLDGAANPVSSVNGRQGAVAGLAEGTDARFPASVTGIRKGNGVGSNDVAAVAGTDFLLPTGSARNLTDKAPYHTLANPAQFQATTAAAISNLSINADDLAGDIAFLMSNNAALAVGALVATIVFGTPFVVPLPPTAIFFQISADSNGSSVTTYPPGTLTWRWVQSGSGASLTYTGLQIVAQTAISDSPTGHNFRVQYDIPNR